MSKQSEAKEVQGYTTAVRNCGNCAHLTSETVLPKWAVELNEDYERRGREPRYRIPAYGVEKRRCGIGGFAIKETAICNEYKPK